MSNDPTPDVGMVRPPPPPAVVRARRVRRRDWRYWVGGAGRTLMTVGILMFGFVAYQLWGTGIEFRQHQEALGNQFEERLAEAAGATDPSTGTIAPTGPSTTGTIAPTGPSTTGPSTTGPLTSVTAAPTWPKIELGDVLAEIEIPKIHKKVFAVAGIRAEDLKQGIGHYPDTPLPGQLGNAAFAGHRTTYGGPLFKINDLVAGDEIIVTTITGQRYVYRMVGTAQVVSPEDYEVIQSSDLTRAMLTLTSCHPRYSAKQRIVVQALLDTSTGVVPAATSRYYGQAGPPSTVPIAPSGADDPTVTAPDQVGTDVGDLPAGTESLSRGWFDDSAAWPHVALWGLAVALCGIGAWLLNRRTRKWWLGPLAALAPFLFTLYFLYQNINRLLPPDL